MVGERRYRGREFHVSGEETQKVSGEETQKLHLPSLVLVAGTYKNVCGTKPQPSTHLNTSEVRWASTSDAVRSKDL